MIAQTCSDWSKSMARQGWEGCFSHNPWQLLISNTTHSKTPPSHKPVSLRALFLSHFIAQQISDWCSFFPSNTAVFRSCTVMEERKSNIFASVFRWWTSQAVVFVFAEWWKAEGMLLGSTWAGAVCAEGHWNSPRLLNNAVSQVNRVKSPHSVHTFTFTVSLSKFVAKITVYFLKYI